MENRDWAPTAPVVPISIHEVNARFTSRITVVKRLGLFLRSIRCLLRLCTASAALSGRGSWSLCVLSKEGGGGSGTVTSPAEGLQSLHKPPFALGQRIQSDFTATAKAAGCSTRRCGSENLLVSQVNSLARLEWEGGGQWFEELSGYHHSGVTESK